jgi:hypothetical protein
VILSICLVILACSIALYIHERERPEPQEPIFWTPPFYDQERE